MENSLQTDEKYMRLAIIEAQKAFDNDEVPVGAVIVAGGKVVGRGHNLVETLTDVTAHAEMQAITAAASALGGKYLIVLANDCGYYFNGSHVLLLLNLRRLCDLINQLLYILFTVPLGP